MKKWVTLLCGCLFFSNTCSADITCNGGEIITASDGTQFCKSSVVMSWYAAHAWCFANGMRLATNQKLCGYKNLSGTCTNMVNSVHYNAWGLVNAKNGTTKHGRVHLKDGRDNYSEPINRAVGDAPTGEYSKFGGITDMYAICEEIPHEE